MVCRCIPKSIDEQSTFGIRSGLLIRMKRLLLLSLLLLHLGAFAATNSIQVFFSPNGGCTEAITNTIAKAKNHIIVAAYSFTSNPIAKELKNAHERGVRITVILDESNKTAKYSVADFLNNAGVAVFTDGKHAISHSKYMVIDNRITITGSFNFSKAAEEENAENLLVIADPEIARKFSLNWSEHLKHSEKYAKVR